MEFHRIHNTKLEIGFNKILEMKGNKAIIDIVEKLTKTKIIIKEKNIFIIW
jgi:hypothetical protein